MFVEMAVRLVELMKPAAPALWSAMMIYLLGYIIVSGIQRPKNRFAVAAAHVCRAALGLFLIWLFLKQFIFVDMNMHRFADSAWLPLIEALFR